MDKTAQPDWQIADDAERRMKPFTQVGSELGLRDEEMLPANRFYGKIEADAVLARVGAERRAKYVVVTAINPTPAGEGKTTTTIGLIDALALAGHRTTGAIRQPSSGPTFNLKGAGAGGGLSQCLPRTPLSIRLTGDIDSVTNAHNLAMTALTSRMQHERNYDDARLAKSGLQRLDIDPTQVQIGWCLDFCAQALRQIDIGQGGTKDGVEMASWFQMSATSEVMAILSLAKDLADLRQRISRMVVARDRQGRDVTTADLEVDGAMCAWLADAIKPNLLQTIGGNPMLVHAGPFANIAIGQSSIIADRLGCALSDYHVTECGFGSDIGYEKLWNIKCRQSGMAPDAAVIVATVKALKHHGGLKNGKGAPAASTEAMKALARGCANLEAHIDIVQASGVPAVVCVNAYASDHPDEVAMIRRCADAKGVPAVRSDHFSQGGAGATALAEAVVTACEQPNEFRFLYTHDHPLRARIETIAREVYGADRIALSAAAAETIAELEADPACATLDICMVKTQYSLSHDRQLLGRPSGFDLPIDEVLVFRGAGFVCPVAGGISLMPGTGSNPAYRGIDVDVETGRITGIR
ncbi:MAG: formyltetrahydrofolate synthetase [Rhodothermales bacterium]|jgi:formyltetrahydrofolate synthetase